MSLWLSLIKNCCRSFFVSKSIFGGFVGFSSSFSAMDERVVFADVAQLVEHFIRNEGVIGSIPIVGFLFIFICF